MTEKCGKCDKTFAESEIAVKCVDCKVNYHATCTRAGTSQNFTKSKNKTLKCDSCASLSNDDRESILEAIRALKNDINKNIDEKVNEVLASVNSLQKDMKTLQDGFSRLDTQQEKLQDRCHKLESANNELLSEVSDLQIRLHDAEQHSRAANIEIVGLPVSHGEDMYTCLQQVASAIGVNFRADDFSIAHRLRSFSDRKHSHPPIIAQFSSRRTKEVWMRAARAKRNLNSVDIHPSLPSSSVFINEHLTPNNKALLGKARRLRKEGKIVFAGFFNGKVLVKECEGMDSIRVTALGDLDKFSGSKNKTSK